MTSTGEPRPIIPALGPFYDKTRDLSWLVVRCTAGGILLVHGLDKVLNRTIAAFAAGSLARRGIEPALSARLCRVLSGDGRCGLHHPRPVHPFLRGSDRHSIPGHHIHAHWAPGFGWNRPGGGWEYPLFWGLICWRSDCAAAGRTRSTASSDASSDRDDRTPRRTHAAAAGLIHTLLSWKAAPPIGRDRVGAGERVDAAAVRIGGVRPDRFRDQHAAPHAVEQLGVQTHLAARIAEHDRVAVGDAERAPRRPDGSSRSGRPSRASEVGVSLKVELRKPRAGEVASRNGCSSSASSITVQWSGQRRHLRRRARRARGCGTAHSASPA